MAVVARPGGGPPRRTVATSARRRVARTPSGVAVPAPWADPPRGAAGGRAPQGAAALDALAALAARLLHTPMAAVTVLHGQRQVFVGAAGLRVRETEREESFCLHTMAEPSRTLLVPDTTADARFADNRLVVGEPRLRAYAGVAVGPPDGPPLGAVCVLDDRVHALTGRELADLRRLAEVAEELLLAWRTNDQLSVALDAQSDQDGVAGVDENGVVLSWNRGAERVLGLPREQAVGRHVLDLLDPGRRGGWQQVLDEALRGGPPPSGPLDAVVRHPSAGRRELEVSLSTWPVHRHGHRHGAALLRDVTDQRRQRRCSEVVQAAALTVGTVPDLREAVTEVLSTTCATFRWPAARVRATGGRPVWVREEHRHPGGAPCELRRAGVRDEQEGLEQEGLEQEEPGPPAGLVVLEPDDTAWRTAGLGSAHLSCAVGQAVALPLSSADGPVGDALFLVPAARPLHPDEAGALEQVASLLSRTVERHRAAAALQRAAVEDVVSGLGNDRALQEALRAAAGSGSPHALLLADLQRFRWVNASLGRPGGDEVLRAVGARVAAAAPDAVVVARLSADQFALLVPGVADREAAARAGAHLRAAAGGLLRVADRPLDVRLGVGVALGPVAEGRSLLADADTALRRAKETGEVEVHDRTVRADAAERLDTAAALHRAVDNEELVLHYQPVVDLTTGATVSTEALVRWRRGGVLVAPDRFVPLAEETGYVVELGRWALHRACADAAAWRLPGPGAQPGVAVNVSFRQLRGADFLDHLDAALCTSGLTPDRLTLEVTESVLASDTCAALATLRAVRDRGVGLALDDFGTGYSSLSYVQRLPVQTLKIDKSFVDPLGSEPAGGALVDVAVRLADALGMATVAEGVETERQADALRELGCHRAQGFRYARPAALEDLPAAVRATAPAA